jgi:hypothetical protein
VKVATSTTTPFLIPIPGTNFQVAGPLTQLAAEQAVSDPVAPPFTLTAAERGVGGAEIDGATVNGKPTQINWNAGQPLPVRGPGPGLDLNQALVRVDAKTITWSLDGAARDFLPGTYTAAASVAIGAGGLGAPVDSATFTAGPNTTLTTHGNVTIVLPAGPLRIEGRAAKLVLVGDLTLTTPDGDQKADRVNFGPGTYEVTLAPSGGHYEVVARLNGPVAL